MGSRDRSGSALGAYHLVRQIGRGGMGEVYEAFDADRDRRVALKVLPEEFAHSAELRARFLREARAVAKLSDPHVIPIHDYGEVDGQLFLDMRYVDGGDLRRLLRCGGMTRERAVDIVTHIAAALDSAHAAGLIHRDVKPENVLVDSTGFAYLADFGLVRTSGEDSLTRTGVPIGSINYMSPERFGTETEVGPKSDVYALGCVLYESISGEKPFGIDSVERIIAGHLHRELPPTGTAFDQVIAVGTAKDPAARYATAGELARDARRALAGEPIAGLAPPVADQSTVETLAPPAAIEQDRPERRHRKRALMGAGAVAAVLLLAAGGYGLAQWIGRDQGERVTASGAGATTTSSPDVSGTSPRAASPVGELKGALDVGVPISTVPCDGSSALIVYANATGGDHSAYRDEIEAGLAAHPGSSYMRTDQFVLDDGTRLGECGSIRGRLASTQGGDTPIYIVFRQFPNVQAACAADDPSDAAYVRILHPDGEVGVDPC
ncbi:serine/threonine-protein kinase [Gordonia iterans]|nr:serine/threonine-protein kinase [Gordonia iterans]